MKAFITSLMVSCLAASASYAEYAKYEGGQFGKNRWPHWYLGVQGSLNFLDDTNVSVNNARFAEATFDNGYGVGATIGYTPGPYGNLLDYTRFELEYFYRENDIEQVRVPGASAALSGDISSNSVMANMYFDIDTGTRVSPYIGAGAGMSSVNLYSNTLGVDDSDRVFAYQFMAGLGWQPEFLLNTVLQVGYRYFSTSDIDVTNNAGVGIEHEYTNHGIEAGARFRF